MKRLNINEYVYIRMNKMSRDIIIKNSSKSYLDVCIEPRMVKINGRKWYKMLLWECFSLMPVAPGRLLPFYGDILIDDENLIPVTIT